MLRLNMQPMKYAKQGKEITLYERDELGNIIYTGYTDSQGNFIYYLDDSGSKIPKIKGEKTGYYDPVDFEANISNKLSEALMKEFGVDDSASYCQIVADKGEIPLESGDLVWKKSQVGIDKDGMVEENTADYIVKGVADEGITCDLFLLQKRVKQ